MTRVVLLLALLSCARPIDLVAIAADASSDAPDASVAPQQTPLDAGAPETPVTPGPIPGVACPGALIFVLGEGNALYAFDPTVDAVKDFGKVTCPELGGANVQAIAVGDDQLLYLFADDAQILALLPGTTDTCKQWGKGVAPPTGGVGFTMFGPTPYLFLGLGAGLFRAPVTDPAWEIVGKSAEPVLALVGSGDKRLYAVLSPPTTTAYRVARLDPDRATIGATVLVPTTALGPDSSGPAGFALWGDTLFIFTLNQVASYVFSTGDVGMTKMVPLASTILAAASPPCASTLD